MLTMSLNLRFLAGTQFTNWDFNSMMLFQGKHIGSNTSGLFTLGDAGKDDGADIDAYFAPLISNLGIISNKRVRSGFVGYEVGGRVKITIYIDNDAGHEDTVTPVSDAQGSGKFFGVRTQKGVYVQVRVDNIDGSDFSIDYIDLLINVLHNKPGGSKRIGN